MKISLIKMRFNEKKFLSIVLLLILPTFLFGSQSLIEVSAEVDSSVITIGDRITYTLTIQHNKDLHIEQPGPGANLGQFEIKDYNIGDPQEENGIVTQKFEYKISVFDTGKFVIPAFPVAFAESDTSTDYQIIQSEPIDIYVESVLQSENAEIKDIKPPQNVPFNYQKWLLIAGGVLFVLLLTGIAIYIIRKRRKGEPIFRKEVIRPAHEIAFEELNDLKSRWEHMLERKEHILLLTQISLILRRYLENRFFVQAMEETTSEIQNSINELEIEEAHQTKAMDVLMLADMVKFAKHVPRKEEVSNAITSLEDFVENTKLVFKSVEKEVEMAEEKPSEVAEVK